MKRLSYKIILIALSLVALLVLNNCSSYSYSQDEKKEKEEVRTPVEVAKVTKGAITATYSGTATLEAEAEAVIVAKISGVVKKIFTEEGDMVKKGEALAKLEDEQLTLELSQAETTLKKLSNEFKRKEALFKDKIISKDAYEQAKYDLQNQDASVGLARLKLAYSTIRAPFAGIVSQRSIKVGNMVQMNQATFTITGSNPLLAVLHVPEREMSKLKKDYPAHINADAVTGETFKGKILRISPVVDAGTGTFKVTVAIHDKTLRLKPGMFTRVQVTYDTHENTLLVPKDTILSEDGKSYVFRVSLKADTGEAKKVEVTTGYRNALHVEVVSGLKDDDTLVTTGLSTLKDNAKVKVI
ncbi:MAG: efflux RND transporter periplasmic adaptor subunit [bacterium]|nr:efflux RND transporter periplasmic adaptor subunit [bacterium]